MALSLSKSSKFGVSGSYWRLLRLAIDCVNKTSDVSVGLYVDKAARDADSEALVVASWRLPSSVGDVPAAYAHLKTLPEFAGAEDV